MADQPDDVVERICRELTVSREEAFFYLEGFNWNLDDAIEACRSKTLPPSSVTTNEKSAAEETPFDVDSLLTVPIEESSVEMERQRSQLMEERITALCSVVPGLTRKPALEYLVLFKGDVDNAAGALFDGYQPTRAELESLRNNPVGLVGERNSYQRRSNLGSSSGDESSTAMTLPSQSQFRDNIAGSSSSILVDTPIMKSSQLEIGNISRRVRNLQPNLLEQQRPQLNPDDIKSFCDITSVNEKQAIVFLNRFNGDVKKAVCYFFDHDIPKPDTAEDDYLSTIRQQFSAMQKAVTSESPKEARAENVNVAVESSSQVDKSKAVQDRIIAESPAVPATTTTIQITLADNTVVKLPFGSEQTVQDIRNVIQALRPDQTREYYLISDTNVAYDDLNITVSKIASGGSTNLFQVTGSD